MYIRKQVAVGRETKGGKGVVRASRQQSGGGKKALSTTTRGVGGLVCAFSPCGGGLKGGKKGTLLRRTRSQRGGRRVKGLCTLAERLPGGSNDIHFCIEEKRRRERHLLHPDYQGRNLFILHTPIHSAQGEKGNTESFSIRDSGERRGDTGRSRPRRRGGKRKAIKAEV